MVDPTPKPGASNIGDRFLIDGGDGDHVFFSTPRTLRLTEAEWFPGRMEPFGDALLFVVEGSELAGAYVAATARDQMPLLDQFKKKGWGSAVVFRLKNTTPSFDSRRDRFGGGMTFIWRV